MSFENFLEAKDSSNRVKAMSTLVEALKIVFNKYDISTRHLIWKKITSEKGKDLVEKLLRNPKTYLSNSEFTKLVEGK